MSFKGKWIFLKTCKRCYLLAYTIFFFCMRSLSCEEYEFVFAWMNHFNSTSEQAVMNLYMLMHGEWWRRGGVHGEWWRGEGVDFISVRVFDKVLFILCRIGWKTSPAVVTFNVTQTTRNVSRPNFFLSFFLSSFWISWNSWIFFILVPPFYLIFFKWFI